MFYCFYKTQEAIHQSTVHNTASGLWCVGDLSAVSSSKPEERDDSQSFFHKPEIKDKEIVNFACFGHF